MSFNGLAKEMDAILLLLICVKSQHNGFAKAFITRTAFFSWWKIQIT